MPRKSVAVEAESATAQTVERLQDMIVSRRLSPGQQIRQEELAEQLGVSRSPLREALRTLEAEGLVRHSAHHGYFVANLGRWELEQIYLMRRMLESEVFRHMTPPDDKGIEGLHLANGQVFEAAARASVSDLLKANRQFHFLLFSFSDMTLVVREIEKLWQLSEAYRAAYLWSPETRWRIFEEHNEMIQAISDGDVSKLIDLADAHRSGAEIAVSAMLLE
jgi:DNA-binding GntR family transcriptional regulator